MLCETDIIPWNRRGYSYTKDLGFRVVEVESLLNLLHLGTTKKYDI